MHKINFSSQFFNARDTLECGQVFRFFSKDNGYAVVSGDKACQIFEEDGNTVVLCEEADADYFYNYFDLSVDYSKIYEEALRSDVEILKTAARAGKGVRILRQNNVEMLFSFLISQNNNIPRIKHIINNLCEKAGRKFTFCGEQFYSFPDVETLSSLSEDFYKQNGFGYRAAYMKELCGAVEGGLMDEIAALSGKQLKTRLMQIKGIGEKVANCACLFGFYRTDSFPVDVWIEKIYREDFSGELKDRKKITAYFENKFGNFSGYFQQYLFYYKRTLEKTQENGAANGGINA